MHETGIFELTEVDVGVVESISMVSPVLASSGWLASMGCVVLTSRCACSDSSVAERFGVAVGAIVKY